MTTERPATLDAVIAADCTLVAYCQSCPHHTRVDVPAIARKLGGRFLAIDLDPLLVCSKCGARTATMRQVPLNTGPKRTA